MPYEPTTNFVDSDDVDLGKKLVTKDYLLSVYGTILENSPASGLVVTPELWVWGNNSNFRLGDGTATTRSAPVSIGGGGTNWKQVSSGRDHMGAIKTDGTLWMWGSNSSGALGTLNTPTVLGPVTTFAGGTDWKQISCGFVATAAIKTDGSLWTWGRGAEGQLGNFDNTDRNTPVTTFIGGNDWKQVSMGNKFVGAIKTDGSLWLWGAGNNGQLGIFVTGNRNTPVTTFAGGNDWKQVSSGGYDTTAIKTDGTLWTWGTGFPLPINAPGDRRTPVTTFAGGNTWKSLGGSTSAIKTDGSLWLWGSNGYGRLGTNDTTPNRSTPVTTFAGGTNWKSVSGDDNSYRVAIKTDGSLWTWGLNSSGQLGTFDTTQRNTPVTTFAGGNNWKQASAGFFRTAAIQTIDYI